MLFSCEPETRAKCFHCFSWQADTRADVIGNEKTRFLKNIRPPRKAIFLNIVYLPIKFSRALSFSFNYYFCFLVFLWFSFFFNSFNYYHFSDFPKWSPRAKTPIKWTPWSKNLCWNWIFQPRELSLRGLVVNCSLVGSGCWGPHGATSWFLQQHRRFHFSPVSVRWNVIQNP